MKDPSAGSRTRLTGERLAAILDVATEVFLEAGFSAASTNDIARRANASKETLYARFPTKEALFLAVLERKVDAVFAEVAGSLPSEPLTQATLFGFAERYITTGVSTAQVRLLRVVTMEADKFPQLGRYFFDLGPRRGREALAQYMASQIALGRLRPGDPALMAEQFLSLLNGGPVRWVVLGMAPKVLSKVQRKQHIAESLELFLRAYTPT